MAYLPYGDDIETTEAGEQESIDGIIKGMTQESQTVETRDGHAVRASHAKSTACVIGKMVVAANLPPELAQGLFAKRQRRHGEIFAKVRHGRRAGDRQDVRRPPQQTHQRRLHRRRVARSY